MSLRSSYAFTLPRGYVDAEGQVHRDGSMRLVTARDELEALRDGEAADDEHWRTIVLLARVVTRLGDLAAVTTDVVEGLFAADLAHLQELYTTINFGDPSTLAKPAKRGNTRAKAGAA